jgi:hypothetical protein
LAAQKESVDQFNDVVSTDHLVNTSDAVESLWTCRRASATSSNKDYSLYATKKCTIAMNTFSKESNMSIRKVVVSVIFIKWIDILSNKQQSMIHNESNKLIFSRSYCPRRIACRSFLTSSFLSIVDCCIHTPLSWLSSTISDDARIVEILCNIVYPIRQQSIENKK